MRCEESQNWASQCVSVGELTIQEQRSRLIVRRNTLQERQRIAYSVRGCSGQLGWIQERVDRDDLLEQGRHHTYR